MIILTGATGFVGRYLVQRLAEDGETVASIVRAPSDEAAEARLVVQAATAEEAVRMAGRSHGEVSSHGEVTGFAGDVTRPLLGLDRWTLAAFERCGISAVWHAAASVRFTDPTDSVLIEENLAGTRNALDLAIRLGAPRFLYVSTAYAAGERPGLVPEALHDPDTTFRNAYERSKCLAEHLVAATCGRQGIGFDILRPGIVVGPRASFSTGGSRLGLYAVLEIFRRSAGDLQAARRPLRCHYAADATLNFVPVDWLAESMMAVWRRRSENRPLHLTADRPAAVSDVLIAIARHLGVPMPLPVAGLPDDADAAERRLHGRLARFRPYVLGGQEFVTSLCPGPELTPAMIDRYVAGFFHEARGAARPVRPRRLPEGRAGAAAFPARRDRQVSPASTIDL